MHSIVQSEREGTPWSSSGGRGTLSPVKDLSRVDPLVPSEALNDPVLFLRGISQPQPEPSRPTKNPFIHLRNETNHYIETAYIYLVYIYHIM